LRDGASEDTPLSTGTHPRSFLPAFPSGHGFDATGDLRRFVEQHRAAVEDPETAYYVSQALEECAALRPAPADVDARWIELAASAALLRPCRGFDGAVIEPGEIVELLSAAARRGEPHAIARMLLFRDIAAPKGDVMADIPRLLQTRDPAVVRDVGAFLSKGEAVWRYGAEEVPAPTAAIAWELAACDLGYECGPASRLVLSLCAFDGRCEAGHYEDALMRYEPPDTMADAQRLRIGILRALSESNWEWLGISEFRPRG
jgi:hypothetical protein